MAANNDMADPHLDDIAASQFAADCETEQSPITQAAVLIEKEADGRDLRFERSLNADLSTAPEPKNPAALHDHGCSKLLQRLRLGEWLQTCKRVSASSAYGDAVETGVGAPAATTVYCRSTSIAPACCTRLKPFGLSRRAVQ
jgi:hypothetical protein